MLAVARWVLEMMQSQRDRENGENGEKRPASGRNGRGRFTPGCRPGPGRPKKLAAAGDAAEAAEQRLDAVQSLLTATCATKLQLLALEFLERREMLERLRATLGDEAAEHAAQIAAVADDAVRQILAGDEAVLKLLGFGGDGEVEAAGQ